MEVESPMVIDLSATIEFNNGESKRYHCLSIDSQQESKSDLPCTLQNSQWESINKQGNSNIFEANSEQIVPLGKHQRQLEEYTSELQKHNHFSWEKENPQWDFKKHHDLRKFSWLYSVLNVASFVMILYAYLLTKTDNNLTVTESSSPVYRRRKTALTVIEYLFFASSCFTAFNMLLYNLHLSTKHHHKHDIGKYLTPMLYFVPGILGLLGVLQTISLYQTDLVFVPNSTALSLAWISSNSSQVIGLHECYISYKSYYVKKYPTIKTTGTIT